MNLDKIIPQIREAIQFLINSTVSKLEGEGWKVYKVGSKIIRVDIDI